MIRNVAATVFIATGYLFLMLATLVPATYEIGLCLAVAL
jgi:hypothetical protein